MKTTNKFMKNAFHSLKLAFFITVVYLLTTSAVYATSFPSGHTNVQVAASVGQYTINLSGFSSPFASIVLISGGTVMHTTTADAAGNFSMSDILVKQGFNQFCLDTVDVKRLGQSEACFTIAPISGNYTRSNIFLPPTIGLFRTQITVGSNAIIWGYSMPGAQVKVHASDGTLYTATADKDGFYQITAYIAKAGSYDLYADATYQNKPSEKPTNKVTLLALTFSEQTNRKVSNWLRNLLTFLFNLPLGPLWLGLPILLLIYILWRKLKGLPIIPQFGLPKGGKGHTFVFDAFTRPRKLHHAWMKGVGY